MCGLDLAVGAMLGIIGILATVVAFKIKRKPKAQGVQQE